MDKINKIGITLQELQKKAKKQSDNPKALGWFQRFNTGNSPINNAFFNQGTGPVESPSGGEVAAPDGGIGMVGPVGESMENKDKTTFYYNKKLQLKEGEDQNLNEDDFVVEVVVDKEDLINAIKYLLRYDNNFVNYSDEEFDKVVDDHWESIRDDYYNDLYDLFGNKEAHSEGCDCEDFTDEFYDDEVECECEEDEDEDFTKTMFEGIGSEDPTFEPEYDIIDPDKFKEIEDFLDKNDLDKLSYDAYSYGYENEYSDFDDFLDSVEAILTPAMIEDLRQAYEDGKADREEIQSDDEMEECIHPYLESNQEKPTNPYDDLSDEILDNFAGYDAVKLYEYMKKEFDDDWRIGLELFEGGKEYKVISVLDEREVDGYELSIVGAIGNELSNADEEVYFVLLDSDIEWGPVDTAEEAFEWASDVQDGYYSDDEDDFEYNDEPLEESVMSELDLDLQDPEYINKLIKNIKALEDEINFLTNQAPKEIRKGGAFDSQEEIDDAIEQTNRELAREKAKLAIIKRGQR